MALLRAQPGPFPLTPYHPLPWAAPQDHSWTSPRERDALSRRVPRINRSCRSDLGSEAADEVTVAHQDPDGVAQVHPLPVAVHLLE